MIDISFEIGGRKVNPNNIGDALEKAALEHVKSGIIKKIKEIRDPETGMSPKIIVKGRDLSNLTFEIEGSAEVIELVRKRLS